MYGFHDSSKSQRWLSSCREEVAYISMCVSVGLQAALGVPFLSSGRILACEVEVT